MTVKRVSITSSYMKVSKAGFDADTASENDLLLSVNAKSAQIIGKGTKLIDNLNLTAGAYPTSTWSGTLNLSYPDYGGVPGFVIQPIVYYDLYSSGSLYSRDIYYTDFFGSQDSTDQPFGVASIPAGYHPASMIASTLSNTQLVVSCSGSGRNQASGSNVFVEYVGAFNYILFRKGASV